MPSVERCGWTALLSSLGWWDQGLEPASMFSAVFMGCTTRVLVCSPSGHAGGFACVSAVQQRV